MILLYLFPIYSPYLNIYINFETVKSEVDVKTIFVNNFTVFFKLRVPP